MGGPVPKKLYYSAETEPVDLSDSELLTVPARNKAFVELTIPKEQSKLGFWWQTSSGDLDFWVVQRDEETGDETLIWPKFRLLTQYVPEKREIRVDRQGTYRLYFDNAHAKLFSKTIKYKYWVK